MKNKKLLVSALLGVSTLAIGAVVGIAAAKKSGFRAYANPVEGEWHHYAERMPGVQPGIKEYWVQCGGNYQFTKPADVDIVDKDNQWDTSGFAADDDRYTYSCVKKIADSAIANTAVDSAPYVPGEGFTSVQGRAFTYNAYNGIDLDISNYDYVTFGLAHTLPYLYIYGGNGGQGDDVEACIANDKNFTLWSQAWYYFTLEKNAEGKWDTYVGIFASPKRASASLKMEDSQKSANNLKDIIGLWNFQLPEDTKIFSTEVYAGEKDQHHYVWDTSKISPVETGTCAVCGDVVERPASAIDFRTNKYGAKLMNGANDVSGWGNGYNGGNKLNAFGATSLAYSYYGWGLFDMHLPRIDFSKYAQVSFKLGSTKVSGSDGTAGTEPTGNPAGFRIGFDNSAPQNFASTWENAEMTNRTLSFTTYANKVVAKISSFGFVNTEFNITDNDIIHGNKSVVIYVGSYLNDSTSYAVLLSDLDLVEKPEAADITDASIKEIQLNKQVRRLEQQDHWKDDPDYADYGNESGHAEYYKFGDREAIHFSAHYANDDPHFGYNSGWSEFRFAHAQAGLKSVTFTYLYEDSNSDTSNDGLGDIHCMAQWYNGSYEARLMNLVNDGQWHTITVSGAACDITHFVMKIFHFTGDIYISNIRYSDEITPVDAAAITDSSIKEIQLNKQVRRVEQEDHWKHDADYATYNAESGHADYVKYGTRDAIHFSAHYDSIVEENKFKYNSGWSEFRFSHAQTGLTSVTFTYLYEDSNADTSNDGLGDIHSMAQWYGAGYEARLMNLVNDGQWHTITVSGAAYDATHFVMKIFHFTGDIYISNIIYSTAEADVTDASIKEVQLNKQVRRLEQQDHWKHDADYATYNAESGHADYVKAGSKDAIHFSAHYDSVNSPTQFAYNGGWSEWRFTHSVSGVHSVTFDYCYSDENTDTSNDGAGDIHSMAQWYNDDHNISSDSKYVGATMTLINDNQWHTMTVTSDGSFDITHFVMKIFHFTGDIYISNLIYA